MTKKAFFYSLRQTLPILFGYIFLGIAFGISLQQAGFCWLWALGISLLVYAGSMQFMLVSLLSSGASLLAAGVMTLAINSRHLFYGLSFLTRFRKMGAIYPYMVCSLTDETYSLLCTCCPPPDIDSRAADFLISLLDHFYWVAGSVLGSLAGQWIPLDFTGIDFSMTALFVVLLLEQCKVHRHLLPALIGLFCALICLLLIGASNFMIPALCVCTAMLLLFRSHIEPSEEEKK